MIASFADELLDLMKRASDDLHGEHEQATPAAIDVDPARPESWLVNLGPVASKIIPGALGGVTTSGRPIDLYRFNRWFNQ